MAPPVKVWTQTPAVQASFDVGSPSTPPAPPRLSHLAPMPPPVTKAGSGSGAGSVTAGSVTVGSVTAGSVGDGSDGGTGTAGSVTLAVAGSVAGAGSVTTAG